MAYQSWVYRRLRQWSGYMNSSPDQAKLAIMAIATGKAPDTYQEMGKHEYNGRLTVADRIAIGELPRMIGMLKSLDGYSGDEAVDMALAAASDWLSEAMEGLKKMQEKELSRDP